jgi:hypothetical protein
VQFDDCDDATLAKHLNVEHEFHFAEISNLGSNFTVLEIGYFNSDESL